MTPRITPSMLKTAGKCLMQVLYFHVMKLKLPPGIARAFGACIHKQTLEVDQATFIRDGAYKPIGELKEGFVSDFAHQYQETDPNDTEAQRLGGFEEAYGIYEKQGLDLLDKYNEDRSVLNGRGVEVPFEIDFGGGTLAGRLDLDVSDNICKDVKTKDLTKPRARRITQKDVDGDRQYDAYAAAKYKLTGVVDQTVTQVTLYKATLPAIDAISSARGIESHKATEELAHRLGRVIEAGAYVPVDKSSQNGWVCSEKFCGAYHPRPEVGFEGCPFGARARVTV